MPASNLSQKINILENFLDKNHLVDKKRPNDVYSLDKDSKKFVLESMVATKIIFPYGSCCNIHGLKDLAIWISDPDPQEVITENVIELPYTYTGTFLYLTEMYLDNKSFFSAFSGCSALQAVVNYLQGRSLLATVSEINTGEFFGRSNYAHPVDKLLSIGAIKSCTKRIISLYYKRYITDEQCFIFNGERSRVNDLLGYPLYIAEILSVMIIGFL